MSEFYFNSEDIQVYPAGFRGQGFEQSKFTTEENLTHLQSFSRVEDGLYVDNRDSNYYILKLKGYTFRFQSSALTSGLSDFSSGNIYAAIKLFRINEIIGYVLDKYDNTSTSNNVLDVSLSTTSKFFGLCITDDSSSITGANYKIKIGIYDASSTPVKFTPTIHSLEYMLIDCGTLTTGNS